MEIKLSFIIPVYNVETYLDECLESILTQATDECEIILIDDGSTDGSGVICDRYAQENNIVSVFHKTNGGLASARNAGLRKARGEYIAFVDSDDRVASGAVKTVLEWIHLGGTDLCFLEAEKFYPDGHTEPLGDQIHVAQIRGKSREKVFSHLATRPKYPGSACTKLYRRAFLENNSLHFPDDGRYSEDLAFVLNCLMCAESFDALAIPYYEYRQGRIGSISYKATKRSFDGMAMFVEESIQMLSESKCAKDEICRCAMSFVAYEYSIMLWRFMGLDTADKDSALAFLCDNSWVMKYGASKISKVIWCVIRIFGVHNTAKLLNIYMELR